MMKDRRKQGARWLLMVLLAVPFGSIMAEASDTGAPEDQGQTLVNRLKALRPDIPIEGVKASPVPGIYELQLGGGTVFYGTEDGRFLFAGDLYELREDDLVNLAEQRRTESRRKLMASVDLKDMVVFSPAGERKAYINVFTDVDCGYCRKLHQEVPRLNKLGIEVRYLAYPRAGLGSRSYEKIVSAWCSDDPNTAITTLKAGKSIPDATCDNPVAAEFELGHKVGVSGTPAIVLEDGRLLPGYMPADELAKTIGLE
jgi:thiol:disulfide interchange protein DsbC